MDERDRRLAALLTRVQELADEVRALAAPQASVSLTFLSPCYDEAANLPALHAAITAACAAAGLADYEILWIENGSRDGSERVMRELCGRDPRLRVVQLSRNFGFQGAITCGLRHARGAWVAVLDADLQDPPEHVLRMRALAEREDADVVFGVRRKRKEPWPKRLCYWAFYRVWSLIADIEVQLDSGDFGIMRRRVVEALNTMPERQRFLRGLRAWSGFRQIPYEYERAARHAGATKFSLRRLFAFAVDGIVAYSVMPLRATMLIGLAIMALAVLVAGAQVALRALQMLGWVGPELDLPRGVAQINLLVSFLIGLNTLCLGVVGEYVGRVFAEAKGRPHYLVRDVFGGR